MAVNRWTNEAWKRRSIETNQTPTLGAPAVLLNTDVWWAPHRRPARLTRLLTVEWPIEANSVQNMPRRNDKRCQQPSVPTYDESNRGSSTATHSWRAGLLML